MSHEFINRATAAIAARDWDKARAELFGPAELPFPQLPSQLRKWAARERDGGYGLRAQVIEHFLAEMLASRNCHR